MAGGISFSDVSYEIFRVFKDKIDYDKIDIYVFMVGICKSFIKINLSKIIGIPSERIFVLDDIPTPNKHDHDFYQNYVNGYFSIGKIIETVRPDCIFMLYDNGQINAMFQTINRMQPKYNGVLVPYIPLDYGNITIDSIKLNCDLIFTPTEFTRKEILNYYGDKTPVKTLHHIVSNPKFKSLDINVVKYLREKYLGKENVGKFVVGAFNANSIRKRWDLVLETFSVYYKLNDNAMLFIKTNSINSAEKNEYNHSRGFQLGPMIQNMCKKHDIPESAIKLYFKKVSIEELNEMFNIVDIVINTTDGEGFGCFPLEMALAKKLTILPNYTSYKDMFQDMSDNNFLMDIEEYPASMIRDNNNIKDIMMGCKYYGVYHNNNSIHDKKVNFINMFTNISMGISTIVVSGRGLNELKDKYENDTGINGLNIIAHVRTMSYAYEIIKMLDRTDRMPNQIQIIISCEPPVIMETYNQVCILKNELENKTRYRDIKIVWPEVLRRYHYHLSPRVGIVDPVSIANRILFYEQDQDLLDDDTQKMYNLVKEKFNDNEFIKVFKEGMDSIGFEIPLLKDEKLVYDDNVNEDATVAVPNNNV